jgi:serine/threonine protein kinase
MAQSQAAQTTPFTPCDRGFVALCPPPILEPVSSLPRAIGGYRVLRELGAGGMAETFVVAPRDRARRERFCLKRLLPCYARRPELIAQFSAEACLLFALRHPNIVAGREFGCHEGAYYLVQELVVGADLNQLLNHLSARGKALPLATCLFIARELSRALAHAHELSSDGKPLGLVHRDVTPSNVLVSTRGQIKLADFGIARVADSRTHTLPGHAKGKSGHMAPEQITCDAIDGRTDLFALGVLLYQLLFGCLPFAGASDFTLMRSIVEGERAPLPTSARHVPQPVLALVDRLLQTDKQARPASARDLEAELTRLGADACDVDELAQLCRTVRLALHKQPAPGSEPTRSEVRPGRRCSFAPSSRATTAGRAARRARHS